MAVLVCPGEIVMTGTISRKVLIAIMFVCFACVVDPRMVSLADGRFQLAEIEMVGHS